MREDNPYDPLSPYVFNSDDEKAFDNAVEDYEKGESEHLRRVDPWLHYMLQKNPEKILDLAVTAFRQYHERRQRLATKIRASYPQVNNSVPISLADRPFDIVDKYQVLLSVEEILREAALLDDNYIFKEDKSGSNARCMTGVYQFIWINKIFKKYCLIDEKCKRIHKRGGLDFCNIRYKANIGDDFYRKDSKYLNEAFERMPKLKQLQLNLDKKCN